MNVIYRNETKETVDIRGLKIGPGENRQSQVVIEHFDEAVRNGRLTLIINDGYRQIPVIFKEPAGAEPSEEQETQTEEPPEETVTPDPVTEETETSAEDTAETSGEADPDVESTGAEMITVKDGNAGASTDMETEEGREQVGETEATENGMEPNVDTSADSASQA